MSRFAQTYEDPSYEYIGEDDTEQESEAVVEHNAALSHAVFEHMVRDLA